jgi:hypothetical protein
MIQDKDELRGVLLPLRGRDIHGSTSVLCCAHLRVSACYLKREEELVVMTLGTIQTGVRAMSPICRTENKATIYKEAFLILNAIINTQLDCKLFFALQILHSIILLV